MTEAEEFDALRERQLNRYKEHGIAMLARDENPSTLPQCPQCGFRCVELFKDGLTMLCFCCQMTKVKRVLAAQPREPGCDDK